jgi:hypothetical protein
VAEKQGQTETEGQKQGDINRNSKEGAETRKWNPNIIAWWEQQNIYETRCNSAT